jgi:hypothetical protein
MNIFKSEPFACVMHLLTGFLVGFAFLSSLFFSVAWAFHRWLPTVFAGPPSPLFFHPFATGWPFVGGLGTALICCWLVAISAVFGAVIGIGLLLNNFLSKLLSSIFFPKKD